MEIEVRELAAGNTPGSEKQPGAPEGFRQTGIKNKAEGKIKKAAETFNEDIDVDKALNL